MDGKDVVGHPGHLWLIAADEKLKFVCNRGRRAAAVRFAENFMAAPAAMIGTATRRDQRNGAHAVMLAPDFDVTGHIDGFAGGPRLSIDVLDLFAGLGAHD